MKLADLRSPPARNVQPAPRVTMAELLDRDAHCAWVALPPRMRIDLCERAGVPHCEAARFADLTQPDRAALRAAVIAHRTDFGAFADGLSRL